MMRVEAGQYAYLGDVSPFVGARLADGSKAAAVIFTRHFATAREAMATLRPNIAAGMVESPIYNRATYSCAAVLMTRFDWPGMTDLAPTAMATPVAAR